MTEEEAKAKWCPFVRFTATPSDDCYPNRNNDTVTNPTNCIASVCMAWRWYEKGQGFCGLSGFNYANMDN